MQIFAFFFLFNKNASADLLMVHILQMGPLDKCCTCEHLGMLHWSAVPLAVWDSCDKNLPILLGMSFFSKNLQILCLLFFFTVQQKCCSGLADAAYPSNGSP